MIVCAYCMLPLTSDDYKQDRVIVRSNELDIPGTLHRTCYDQEQKENESWLNND